MPHCGLHVEYVITPPLIRLASPVITPLMLPSVTIRHTLILSARLRHASLLRHYCRQLAASHAAADTHANICHAPSLRHAASATLPHTPPAAGDILFSHEGHDAYHWMPVGGRLRPTSLLMLYFRRLL